MPGAHLEAELSPFTNAPAPNKSALKHTADNAEVAHELKENEKEHLQHKTERHETPGKAFVLPGACLREMAAPPSPRLPLLWAIPLWPSVHSPYSTENTALNLILKKKKVQ